MSLTISSRLWLITIFISLTLLGLWQVNQHFQARIDGDYRLSQQVSTLQQQLLRLRIAEKDFLHHRKLFYRDQFEEIYENFQAQYTTLLTQVRETGLDATVIESMSADFDSYAEAFRKVVAHQLRIGLSTDDGLYGELAKAARDVETVITSDPGLHASLLTLRRHEKDFLLRRDATYYTRFGTAMSDFRGALFMSDIDNATQARLQEALGKYSDSFSKLLQEEVDIGLDDQSGLIGELAERVATAENSFATAHNGIAQKIAEDLNAARQLLTIIIAVIIAVTLMALLYTRTRIVRQLNQAVSYANTLERGEWQHTVPALSQDETGKLLAALEALRVELLRKARQVERDSQHKGRLAELSRILQGIKHSDTLGTDVLQYLVRALQGQVGALYLTEAKDQLVFCAGYALARDQSVQTHYAFGESLIGQAAASREAKIYTDLPGHFLRITSGSGEAPPASLAVSPLLWNDQVYGVIEIGALQAFDKDALLLLQDAGEMLAVALHAAKTREDMQTMLARSQAQTAQLEAQQEALEAANGKLMLQAEQLQQSEEELRVQQEELQAQQEEQRALNEGLEAQSRLLSKRTRELEQRNVQLEDRLLTSPAC